MYPKESSLKEPGDDLHGKRPVRPRPQPDRAPTTVLVVDDDAAVRQMLTDLLHAEGFVVLAIATGAGLADVVRQRHPDVVLLDQVMRPVSGLEALQALRASGQDVPVIMLSALEQEYLVQTALDAGADDYVTKPFSAPVLVARVRMAQRRRRWQARQSDA